MRTRVKRLFDYRVDSPDLTENKLAERDVRSSFNTWFLELGIPRKGDRAPLGQFAKIIAPHYKRSVMAKFDGILLSSTEN